MSVSRQSIGVAMLGWLLALPTTAVPAVTAVQPLGPPLPSTTVSPVVTTMVGPTPPGPSTGPSTAVSMSAPTTFTATALPIVSKWPVPTGQLHRKLAEAKTGPNPKQVAFTPNGKELWTPLLGSTGVDVFRVPDLQKIARIPLGTHGGVEVIFTRDGKRAYVSQMQTASVYEIDAVSKRVLRVLKTGGNWTKILELSPDEKTLYAANWVSNDISVIDLATGRLQQKVPTVKTPRGLIVSDDGNTIFVAGFENGEIVRIDLKPPIVASGSSTTSLQPTLPAKPWVPRSTVLYRTGGAMRHLALDRKAGVMYADDMGRDAVFTVDVATGTVRTLAKTDSHPNTIDLSLDAKYLYVSNRGQNSPKGYNQYGPDFGSVIVLDVATGKAVDAIVGGNQTTGLDVSPDGTLLAFTDFQDARVQLYAIPSSEVLAKSDGVRVATYKRELLRKRK
jgi:YVTN family beta-propeller protein